MEDIRQIGEVAFEALEQVLRQSGRRRDAGPTSTRFGSQALADGTAGPATPLKRWRLTAASLGEIESVLIMERPDR